MLTYSVIEQTLIAHSGCTVRQARRIMWLARYKGLAFEFTAGIVISYVDGVYSCQWGR